MDKSPSLPKAAVSSPSRRRKAQLACNYCRERKTRCDGAQPSCTPCRRRGRTDDCTYEESALNTQRYVNQLERRVKELEKLTRNFPTPLERGVAEPASSTRGSISNDARGVGANSVQSRVPASDTVQSSLHVPDGDAVVDGLATVSPVPFQDCGSVSFGGSSTIAFLRNLLSAVDGTSSIQHQAKSSKLPPRTNTTPSASRLDVSSLVLPNRHFADNCVEAFFNIVHPLYPIIHQTSFLRGYRELWHPPDPSSVGNNTSRGHLFWATVNLVFALGCQFDDETEPSRRPVLANEFYHRSHDLWANEVIDTASVEGIQALLLTSIYLQSTHHASRCWNVLGLAIRAAQALGFHLEHRHQSVPRQLDREVGRRLWYNCVVLDKLQSMTFGRPSMLGSHGVKLPAAIDDEFLNGDQEGGQEQPRNCESQLSFFVSSIELFDILSDILSTMYLSEKGTSTDGGVPDLVDIIRLNAQLEHFGANIPHHLRHDSVVALSHREDISPQKRDIFKLQANVLHCRFLYAQLLLLRPLLLAACAKSQATRIQQPSRATSHSLEAHLVARACELSAQTAISLIDNIHTNMHSVLRNSVWYTVYFTFSAATVLVAARICSLRGAFNEPLVTETSFQTSWAKILAILGYHEDRIASAGRAKHVLEALGTKVDGLSLRDEGARHLQITQTPASMDEQQRMQEPREWTAEDFNVLNLSNAWFLQEITSLDFLDFEQQREDVVVPRSLPVHNM